MNPKKNLVTTNFSLIEQFRQKGYICMQVQKLDSTTIICRHRKKLIIKESEITGNLITKPND